MLILLFKNLLWARLTSFSPSFMETYKSKQCDLKTSVFKKESSESVIFPVKVNLSDRLWGLCRMLFPFSAGAIILEKATGFVLFCKEQ